MPYKVIIYNDDKFKMNLKSDRPISAAKKAKKYNDGNSFEDLALGIAMGDDNSKIIEQYKQEIIILSEDIKK